VRALGAIGAITTIGTAVVPENLNTDLHGIISMVNIEFLATAAMLSGLFLYRQPGFWRVVAVVALASELAAVAFAFLLHTFWMEWLTVGLVLVYVGLLTLDDRRAAEVRRASSSSAGRPTPART
jgi:urea transporter